MARCLPSDWCSPHAAPLGSSLQVPLELEEQEVATEPDAQPSGWRGVGLQRSPFTTASNLVAAPSEVSKGEAEGEAEGEAQ